MMTKDAIIFQEQISGDNYFKDSQSHMLLMTALSEMRGCLDWLKRRTDRYGLRTGYLKPGCIIIFLRFRKFRAVNYIKEPPLIKINLFRRDSLTCNMSSRNL